MDAEIREHAEVLNKMSDPEPLRIEIQEGEGFEDFWYRAAIELQESPALIAVLFGSVGDEVARILRDNVPQYLKATKLKLEAECNSDTFRQEIGALITKHAKARKQLDRINTALKKGEAKHEAPVK